MKEKTGLQTIVVKLKSVHVPLVAKGKGFAVVLWKGLRA
jgi:hypothetical protein